MTERIVTVNNRAGIHARPSAVLVSAVKNFNCSIYLEKDNDRINGKSIMGVMTLGAAYGTELKIITDGEDEEKAADILVRLIESKFEEE
ncbi:MAG: HPr family phosphocarrier protein [Treponema sp.]|jgi:phosphocarrier protein|nr:HPr family phosphocarrier protein [Treponema sp.]